MKKYHPYIFNSESGCKISYAQLKTSWIVFFQKKWTSFETSANATTFFFSFFSFEKSMNEWKLKHPLRVL
ncbi:hypothetical protein ACM55G_12070 [Flavobacterium sp. LB3P122]